MHWGAWSKPFPDYGITMDNRDSWIASLLRMPWWQPLLFAAAALCIPYLVRFIFPAGATQSGIAFKNSIVGGLEILSYLLAASLLLISLYALATKPLPPKRGSARRAPAKQLQKIQPPAEAAKAEVAGKQADAPHTAWSLELLQSLDRARFKTLCRALFGELGLIAKDSDCGADFDLYSRKSPDAPIAIAKFKAGKESANANDILEFCGIVDQTGMGKSYFAVASSFTDDARNFSETCDVALISGWQLLKLIESRPQETAELLLRLIGEEHDSL